MLPRPKQWARRVKSDATRGAAAADFDGGGGNGAWTSWFLYALAEVDAAHALALALQHGMTVTHPPTNAPWGFVGFIWVIPTATRSGSVLEPARIERTVSCEG
jgi:hypothetical protein